MKMTKSNQFLAMLVLLTSSMMLFTNFNLAKEYEKIDLSDPFKNYISLESKPFSVLKLLGSNGYPIEVRQSDVNEIKVLRSRIDHVIQKTHADTMSLEFTGASISKQQSQLSTSPPAIVILRTSIQEIIATDVHCKIADFAMDNMKVTVNGEALAEIADCHLSKLKAEIAQQGHLEFFHQNSIDSVQLTMKNSAVAFLKNVTLHHIDQDLGDSVSIVLSNRVFDSLIE